MDRIEPSKIFDSSYYSINKNLLNILGLWPSVSKIRQNLSLALFTFVSFSLIIPILAGFKYIWGVDWVAVIENCVGFLYLSAVYSKYVSAYVCQGRIELVYKQTVMDWKSLTDAAELKILHKYSRLGRTLTILYVGYSLLAVCVFNSFPYIPLVLDVVMPLENGSRPRVYPYHPDYFVIDAEKYYFELYTLHGIFVIAFSTLAPAAIDSMMVANIIHACGLFAVVCFILLHLRWQLSKELHCVGQVCSFFACLFYAHVTLVDHTNEANIDDCQQIDESEESGSRLADDRLVYRQCKKVCQLHLSSINSVDQIQDSFSMSFLIVMGAGMVAIGMLMFDFLYSLDPFDVVRIGLIFVLLFGIKVCLFYTNWVVQQVINSSEEVFQYAYRSEWYNLSVESRKLVAIIMQNSMKPVALSAMSICDLNLQMFAAVVKTSGSYATVMLSMQKQ